MNNKSNLTLVTKPETTERTIEDASVETWGKDLAFVAWVLEVDEASYKRR